MANIVHRSIGVGVGIFTVLALFLIVKFPIWWVLLLVFIIWLLIIRGFQHILRKIIFRKDIQILTVVTMLAFIGLLLFVEWNLLRSLLVLLGGTVIALLHSWSVPSSGYTTHIEKSYRRILMMLWVFDTYGILTTLFAIDVFFQGFSFWLLSIFSGALFAFVSFMIWRMYYDISFRRATIWMSCIGFIGIELVWVFRLLPLGYTALGLFVTWIWYIVQLLFRFHFSKAGVQWKRQRIFLGVNLILFVALMFVVSWI